jgi:hypothetical protein
MQYLARVIAQGGHEYLAYRVVLVSIVFAIAAAVIAWLNSRSLLFVAMALAFLLQWPWPLAAHCPS